MTKENSMLAKACDKISKYSVYILAVLMPLFLLPLTSNALDFNKQSLLILLVFIAVFAQIAKILISGKLTVSFSKIHIPVLVLFLVYLLSTIFSLDKYGSFWGWPLTTSESFLSIIGLALLYFLVSNLFAKKEIITLVVLSAIFSGIAVFIGVFQMLGLFLPFGFAQSPAFNTIGSVGTLGIFLASVLPLIVFLIMVTGKWLKIIFGAIIVAMALAFVLINFSVAWWVVLIGMILVFLLGMFKRDVFDLRWFGLPMFFLVIALFFIILKPQIPTIQRPVEIYLTQSMSADIALKTIKDRPIFGSGPGTFMMDFSKYKDADFNKNLLWNVRFNSAGTKAINTLAETGVLGTIAFLGLIAIVVLSGIKFLFLKQESKKEPVAWIITAGILLALLTLTIGFFLYSSNLSLNFIFFLLLASFAGLLSDNFSTEGKKEYILSPSSLLTLAVTFVFTLILIFGSGILILNGARYVAELRYFSAQNALVQGNLDDGIAKTESAVGLNSKLDIYFTDLSQLYLAKMEEKINQKELPDQEKTQVQILINNSINASKIATDISPNKASNWSIRGFVYQSLIGIVPEAENWAINSYNKAIELESANPYYATQKGYVYFKTKEWQKSVDEFVKALELKPDQANTMYFLGLAYDKVGQKEKAIEQIKKVVQMNPNLEEAKKVLDNLKSGRPALQGIVQEVPVEPPSQMSPEDVLSPNFEEEGEEVVPEILDEE